MRSALKRKAHAGKYDQVEHRVSTVVLGRGERWCAKCGESMQSGGVCPRCDGHESVDPTQVLFAGEYMVL